MTEEIEELNYSDIDEEMQQTEQETAQIEPGQEETSNEQEPEPEEQAETLETIAENEITRDMAAPMGREEQEYQGDREKFNAFIATPTSGDIYPMIDGKQILNKDLPNSYLSSYETNYLEMLNIGILACLDEPVFAFTALRYARYMGFKSNIAPAKGGWGRALFNTAVTKKDYSLDSNKKEAERRRML